jgi:hypothetical protein
MEAAEVVEDLPPQRTPAMPDAARELDKRNDQELKDWILSLRPGTSLRVVLKRLHPKKADDGTPVVGKCDEYDEPVSEDEIKERHGGGKFEVIVQKPGPKGGWVFFRQATIEIPGPPDFRPVLGPAGRTPSSEGHSTVDRVLGSAERQIDDARRAQKAAEERAERALLQAPTGGLDEKMINMIQAPLLEELRNARTQMSKVEDRYAAIATTKPDHTFQERIYEKLSDSTSKQLETLRQQHDSELRQLRDNHHADLKRLEDRHEKLVDRLEDSHKREISGMERSHASELKAADHASSSRIDQLKSDISRLERELTAKDTELARLRAMKEKSPMESLEDAVKLKEHLVDLGLAADPADKDDEDDDSKMPGWVKGLTVLLDNPVAQGFAERIAGAPHQQQQQPPAQQQIDFAALQKNLKVGQAVELPDGRLIVKREDGTLAAVAAAQVQALRQRKAALAKKRAAEKAAVPAVDASGNPVAAAPAAPPLRIAKHDLARVVQFIEGAIANGTTPEQFAQTAATMASKPVMQAIKKQTVEWFLEQADVDDSSSINTQAGRDWLRRLSAVLKGPQV